MTQAFCNHVLDWTSQLLTNVDDGARFKPFFQKIISAFHSVPVDATHKTDWSLENLEDLPPAGVLNLAELGLSGEAAEPGLPIRVQVSRNLRQFPLTGAMSRDERVEMERFVLEGIERGLIESPEYGGKYHSFTPGHSHQIPAAEYQGLIKAGLAFKVCACLDHSGNFAGFELEHRADKRVTCL
jgi:hypothetical protein